MCVGFITPEPILSMKSAAAVVVEQLPRCSASDQVNSKTAETITCLP